MTDNDITYCYNNNYTDGDLEELQDELNDGKMQYAAIKVLDPNTNLPKIVWINWVRVCHSKFVFVCCCFF